MIYTNKNSLSNYHTKDKWNSRKTRKSYEGMHAFNRDVYGDKLRVTHIVAQDSR